MSNNTIKLYETCQHYIGHRYTPLGRSLIVKCDHFLIIFNKLSVSTGYEKIPRGQTEVAPSRHIQRSGGGD